MNFFKKFWKRIVVKKKKPVIRFAFTEKEDFVYKVAEAYWMLEEAAKIENIPSRKNVVDNLFSEAASILEMCLQTFAITSRPEKKKSFEEYIQDLKSAPDACKALVGYASPKVGVLAYAITKGFIYPDELRHKLEDLDCHIENFIQPLLEE